MSSKNKGPIAMVLPRGEAIRNFVYMGALEAIRKERRCSLISVKPSPEIWDHLGTRCDELHELAEFRDAYPVRLLREVLDVAHGRWLWSEAAQERWRLRDLEAITAGQKLKRLGKKLGVLPFANRAGLGLLSGLERSASRTFLSTQHYMDLFRRMQPSLVFNGSHVHSANAIHPVQAAQWLGIPTATFIFSWDNLTSQGRVMPPYDYYIVWNPALKDQLLDIYRFIKPEQVFVTGTPQFDSHFNGKDLWTRDEFCRRIGADPTRPIVQYATGMPNHMPAEDEIVESIADILKDCGDLGRPQLMVRLYAKDRSGRFEPLRQRRKDILFPPVPWEVSWLTPKPEDLPLWSNTLRHTDVGINVASTVSLELCMFDKPVINIGFNPESVPESQLEYHRYYSFDHYAPVVRSGAVRVARSKSQLRDFIRQGLSEPSKERAQRATLVKDFFGNTLDGKSGVRAAEVLLRLAGGR